MLLCKCLFEKSVFSSAQRSCDYRSAATFWLQLSNESGGWPTATISAGCKEVEGRKMCRLTRILKTLYQWQWQCRPVFELDVEITLVIAALLIRGLGPVHGPFSNFTLHVDNPTSRSGGGTDNRTAALTEASTLETCSGLCSCVSLHAAQVLLS